jgi:hypothetical protein
LSYLLTKINWQNGSYIKNYSYLCTVKMSVMECQNVRKDRSSLVYVTSVYKSKAYTPL